MRAIYKLIGAAFAAVVLGLFAALCISSTAEGQTRDKERETEQYYDELERAYIRELGSLLKEQGYADSGITMTCTRQESGERSYVVLIHHRRIEYLSDEQIEELRRSCQTIRFPAENCSFFHEFLICGS